VASTTGLTARENILKLVGLWPSRGEVRRALGRSLWIQGEGLLKQEGARLVHEETLVKDGEGLAVPGETLVKDGEGLPVRVETFV
jgi:hypothetical protein